MGAPGPAPPRASPVPGGLNPPRCSHARRASQAQGSRHRPQPSPTYLDARRPRPGGGCAGTRDAGTTGERASGSPHCSGAALHARPRAARSCCTPRPPPAQAGPQPVSPHHHLPAGPPTSPGPSRLFPSPAGLPTPAPSPTGAGSWEARPGPPLLPPLAPSTQTLSRPPQLVQAVGLPVPEDEINTEVGRNRILEKWSHGCPKTKPEALPMSGLPNSVHQ
ncbi:uncharacterized protein LOC144581316 [Callithrix jacchus]